MSEFEIKYLKEVLTNLKIIRNGLEYKYKIKCKDCGQIYYRKRLNKNLIKKYRCGKCKGKLELI